MVTIERNISIRDLYLLSTLFVWICSWFKTDQPPFETFFSLRYRNCILKVVHTISLNTLYKSITVFKSGTCSSSFNEILRPNRVPVVPQIIRIIWL